MALPDELNPAVEHLIAAHAIVKSYVSRGFPGQDVCKLREHIRRNFLALDATDDAIREVRRLDPEFGMHEGGFSLPHPVSHRRS